VDENSSTAVRVLEQAANSWEALPAHSWEAVLAVVALCIEAIPVWKVTLAAERPPIAPDAALFQHAGWYLTNGARLYADVWDVKLPLTAELTAILATVAGDDVYALHLLSVGTMVLAACGIVVLVGRLTYELTADAYASTIAGLSMFLLAGFHVRPAYGVKARYFLLLAGLLAIYLSLRDAHFWSGTAAAASVGFWQLGAIFPVVLLALAAQRRDGRALARIVAGGVAFSALMFAPVLAWGTASEMLVQAVIVPLALPEQTGLLPRVVGGVAHFKYASPLVLLGSYGLLRGARRRFERTDWWVVAFAVYFGLIVFFVDFEVGGYTDLIAGLAFVAIGLGAFAATLDRRVRRHALTAAVLAVLVVNVAALGSLGLVFPSVSTPGATPMRELQTNERAIESPHVSDDQPGVRYVYWNRLQPDTCHYRLSLMEVRWLSTSAAYRSDPGECLGLDDGLRVLFG
jgi:hypothetical protein